MHAINIGYGRSSAYEHLNALHLAPCIYRHADSRPERMSPDGQKKPSAMQFAHAGDKQPASLALLHPPQQSQGSNRISSPTHQMPQGREAGWTCSASTDMTVAGFIWLLWNRTLDSMRAQKGGQELSWLVRSWTEICNVCINCILHSIWKPAINQLFVLVPSSKIDRK